MFGISAACARSAINGWVAESHKRSWPTVQGCRWSKLMVPEINKKLADFLLSCNRKDCRLLVGVLTGHNAYTGHLCTIGISEINICSSCMESEDSIEHFLCYCPAFSSLRQKFLGGDVIGTESVGSLSIKSLLVFLKETGKFTE